MQNALDREELKALFKAALIEVLEERPDLLRAALENEEERAFGEAMESGRQNDFVSRDEVFRALQTETNP